MALAPIESKLHEWPGAYATDAWDEALRLTMAQALSVRFGGWYSPSNVPEQVIGPILELYGLEGLDTTILGLEHRRRLLALGVALREARGTARAIHDFSDLTGINARWRLVRGANNKPIAVRYSVEPPVGLVPRANWQRYIRRALIWLTPERLSLEALDIGVSETTNAYVYLWSRPFVEGWADD